MLRDTKTDEFFELGRIIFIAQNKKGIVLIFQNHFQRLFHTSFRNPNPVLDEPNL